MTTTPPTPSSWVSLVPKNPENKNTFGNKLFSQNTSVIFFFYKLFLFLRLFVILANKFSKTSHSVFVVTWTDGEKQRNSSRCSDDCDAVTLV